MAFPTAVHDKVTLKRVGALSAAKVMGAVYGGMGLIFGAIFSFVALLGAGIGAASGGGEEAFLGLVFGVGAILLMPLFYGLCGLIAGLIGASLYNLAAKLVGGLEVELESSGGS